MFPLFGQQTWVTPYGLMLVIGLVACWFFARRRAQSAGIDASYIDLYIPLIFIISTLGGKLLALVSPHDANIAGELYQTHSRFRLFGLLLFAVPLVFMLCRFAGLSFRIMIDVLALPAVLWLAFLRAGCFMAGCCWGDLVHEHTAIVDATLASQVHTLPWLSGNWIVTAVTFPEGSFAHEQHFLMGLIDPIATRSLLVHPTQLYELIGLLFLLFVMHRYEKTQRKPGMTAIITLASYCMLRFIIEYLRADNALVIGSHTFTQLICIIFLLATPVIVKYLALKGKSR